MMKAPTRDPIAKLKHLEACIMPQSQYEKSAGFDAYCFENNAAADVSLKDIDIALSFLGKTLKAPLMIAPMTGGIEKGHTLNRLWAKAAEHFQIPMGVGSQRLGLEQEERASWYHVRKDAPTAVIFANLGAAQLALGYGEKELRKAVDMIEADGIFIHFNALQEAIQEGNVDFKGVLKSLSKLCQIFAKDNIPIFAREVCFGISAASAKRLIDSGVKGIDCGGAGGTSWAKVEALCASDERRRQIGMRFSEWGIETASSIVQVRSVAKDIKLIATGGLRSGVDVAKALALGADIASMARPMLLSALEGEEALHAFIEDSLEELKICMFGIGAKNLNEIRNTPALIRIS